MAGMIRRRLTVRGRVQKVGFRAFARDAAGAFDIRGWVRNDPDGSVEIDAQGTADNLRSFIEQIEIGPPSSRVDDLEVEEREADDRPDEFGVVR